MTAAKGGQHTAHTPGPWSAPSAGVYGPDGLLVCTLGTADVVRAYKKRGYFDGGAVIAANARLIAAAPELLAALERLIAQAQRATEADEPTDFGDIDAARAALASVRGGK